MARKIMSSPTLFSQSIQLYIAEFTATQEAFWIKYLLEELGIIIQPPIIMSLFILVNIINPSTSIIVITLYERQRVQCGDINQMHV